MPLLLVSPNNDKMVTVSVVRLSSASTLTRELAGKTLEMTGSAVSLLIKEEADIMKDKLIGMPIPKVRLIMALGEPLPMADIGCVKVPIRIDKLAIYNSSVFSCRRIDNTNYPWAGLFTATQLSHVTL